MHACMREWLDEWKEEVRKCMGWIRKQVRKG
jgi:hypothetical protein